MATSGSVSTSSYQGRYLKLSWERTSYSIANNTSTIKWTLSGAGSASSSWYYTGNFTVEIAGETVYDKASDYRIKLYNGTTVATGTKTIKHNTDGTKSFSISVKAGIYTYAKNVSGSGTFTLNTIPRASSVSATAADVGSASTITISRASSSFTHTLTYTFGDLSGTIATKTSNTSIAWTLPTSFYAEMPSATSKTGTITCITYNGSYQIGDAKTCSFTAKVPSSQGPSLSVSISATDDLTNTLCGTAAAMIKGVSTMQVVATGTAKNSATIKSFSIKNGSTTQTTSTASFEKPVSNVFTSIVTDSRGYTATNETTFTPFVNYITLTNIFTAKLNAEGVLSFSTQGDYYNGNFINNANTLTVQYRYKESGGTYTDWVSVEASISGNTYSYSGVVTGLDYKKIYTFQTRAVDKAGEATATAVDVKAIPVFDWGENDFHFHVPVFTSAPVQIHALTGGCKTATTLGDDNTIIPVKRYGGTGEMLEISDDGGIKCLSDGVVLVSGAVHVTGLTAGNSVYAHININKDTDYAATFAQTGSKTFTTIVIAPRVVGVSAGDIIYLSGGNYNEAKGNVAVNNNTILTVVYLSA